MRKVKRLMILGLCLTSCSNPNNVINTNTTPSPTISSSTSVIPIPSISSSVTSSSPTPTVTPTPSVSENPNAIKKVELYNRDGSLFYSPDKKLDLDNNVDMSLSGYYYYDLDLYAKITFNNDKTENREVILKSSNEVNAHFENNRLFTHPKEGGNNSFDLIVLDKKDLSQITSLKIIFDFLSLQEFINIKGKIYDTQGNTIKEYKISIKSLNTALEKMSNKVLISKSIDGLFSLKYVPVGVELELTVSKEGYKTVRRKLVPKSNLSGVESFEMNFGGTNEEDKPYALEKL